MRTVERYFVRCTLLYKCYCAYVKCESTSFWKIQRLISVSQNTIRCMRSSLYSHALSKCSKTRDNGAV